MDRLSHWKIPDIEQSIWYLMHHEGYSSFRTGIKAGILGWILSEVGGDFHPMLKRAGNLVKNVGIGAAIGSGVGSLLWLPGMQSNPGVSSGFQELSKGSSATWGYRP